MADNTLLGRCTMAYAEAWNERIKTLGPGGRVEWPDDAQRQGTRAVIEHLAAELVVLGHIEAARSLTSQLCAEVIELRPDRGGAA
jgi:glycine cleavage system protein P-like pyridoxal-binding family